MARFTCQAVLFDLDGVLVDSRACVERQWSVWADRHGLERGAVLRTAHGRRAVEVVAALAPHLDALREAAALAVAEMADSSHLARVPGAAALLRSIPRSAWAITTSAPRAIAVARLAQAGLDVPGLIVAAEDVAHGKPDPQGYLVAAGRLGVSPESCVVVEDAPAGIAAARAAGMRVVAVAATYPPGALRDADACVGSLTDLTVIAHAPGATGQLTVEAREI